MARIPSPTRQVWTVVYSDPREVGGMGVAHFDDEAEAIRLAANATTGTACLLRSPAAEASKHKRAVE